MPSDPSLERTIVRAVDLRERFGDRYRIRWEADGSTCDLWAPEDQAWLLEIPCKYGVVYPHGGDILAASVRPGHPRIGKRLRSLPCILTARGDEETVVTFRVDDADEVFGILRPYRRRRLSEAQRRQCIENLARAGRERARNASRGEQFRGSESTRLQEPGASTAIPQENRAVRRELPPRVDDE